jgi:ubiquinone/menaquinone biosynthesis C-methylase UbiE
MNPWTDQLLPRIIDVAMRGDSIAASGVDVEFIGLDGQHIPLEDNSCDAGLLTYTLCTIPDPLQGLAELRRIIKPGGTLHFVEHGEAPDERVRRWQRRVAPIQKKVAAGCHLNRPIVELLETAGFEIEWTDARYHGRPKVGTYFTAGVARNP